MAVDIDHTTKASPVEPLVSHDAPSRVPGAFRRGRWRTVVVVLAILAAGGAAAMWYLRSNDQDGTGATLVYEVARGDLEVVVTEQGVLESSRNHEIKCRVKGQTTVLWVVKTGTTVKPGDVLVRLDTSEIEDRINTQKIAVSTAEANKRIAESEVEAAKIAVTEYLEGTFEAELAKKQQELVTAQSDLKTARNTFEHGKRLFRKGYINRLQYESQQDAVRHAELAVHVKETELKALQRFTRAKMLEELRGKLEAAKARLAGYAAQWELELSKLRREEEQLKNCVIRAETGGLVIYPSAAEWRSEPDIAEGAKVREDQVLLMIPDLSRMQVKIGIHESKVDRVKPGLPARVQIRDTWVEGRVKSVASVTRPTGWWNGNIVRYDTVIELIDNEERLKPGMSVAVEVRLARYENVLTIPVATVVESADGAFYCWVETETGPERRRLQLGDTNDQFVVVESGVAAGDAVVLNPTARFEEARSMAKALKSPDGTTASDERKRGKTESASGEKATSA